jgi:hypothetical protein
MSCLSQIARALRSTTAVGLLAASALMGTAAHAATSPQVSFKGAVNGGRFSVDLFSFDVANGQVATLAGDVASGAYDSVAMVPVSLGSLVIAVPLTIHYDALSFSDIRLGLSSDTDLSNGFSFSGITAGHYTLTLEGTSATGGVYAGVYTLATADVGGSGGTPGNPAPIPEPTNLALAVTALGLLGWRGRRVIR